MSNDVDYLIWITNFYLSYHYWQMEKTIQFYTKSQNIWPRIKSEARIDENKNVFIFSESKVLQKIEFTKESAKEFAEYLIDTYNLQAYFKLRKIKL